jgi:endonuclease/exonuclease/phosphatase family metal-dependent hydrolase
MTRLVAAIVFSCFCLQTGVAAQTSSIRVMTFNIRYDEPHDGVNAWPNRKQKVADVIRFHKADIVGVQEGPVSATSRS